MRRVAIGCAISTSLENGRVDDRLDRELILPRLRTGYSALIYTSHLVLFRKRYACLLPGVTRRDCFPSLRRVLLVYNKEVFRLKVRFALRVCHALDLRREQCRRERKVSRGLSKLIIQESL